MADDGLEKFNVQVKFILDGKETIKKYNYQYNKNYIDMIENEALPALLKKLVAENGATHYRTWIGPQDSLPGDKEPWSKIDI